MIAKKIVLSGVRQSSKHFRHVYLFSGTTSAVGTTVVLSLWMRKLRQWKDEYKNLSMRMLTTVLFITAIK